MTELLAGKFTNAIMDFQVVDCRFGYEYEGGHIPGAINLNTVEKVVGTFSLRSRPSLERSAASAAIAEWQSRQVWQSTKARPRLPLRVQLQACPDHGSGSATGRSSSGARLPNCHFPEIYILQGGYCNFFQSYANLCEPQQYICMDDPRFLANDRPSSTDSGNSFHVTAASPMARASDRLSAEHLPTEHLSASRSRRKRIRRRSWKNLLARRTAQAGGATSAQPRCSHSFVRRGGLEPARRQSRCRRIDTLCRGYELRQRRRLFLRRRSW